MHGMLPQLTPVKKIFAAEKRQVAFDEARRITLQIIKARSACHRQACKNRESHGND